MTIDLNFDRDHIWHPYTSLIKPLPTYPVARAEGVRFFLEDGRELVDGMASWWSAIHGYGHPRLKGAAQRQIETMSHVMFGGIIHEPAVALCKKLVEITPEGLDKVFLSDSGSISVEVGLKMALQYWYAQGKPRSKFLTVRGGYHGDTFAAMSVCDPDGGMHRMWRGFLPEHLFGEMPPLGFDRPFEDDDLASVRAILEAEHEEIAALVLEPIVQGAGGMRIYSPAYLEALHDLAREYGLLVIFDEIATNFGRTGRLFATDYLSFSPDILCIGKALTGGMMTGAATLCSQKVADGIGSDGSGVLMHGPTFMANPLMCAVAHESISLLLESPWEKRVANIEAQLKRELEPARALDSVADVRVLGAIGVIETKTAGDMARLQAGFVERGVWVRPFGRLIYIMPPFVIEPDQLSRVTAAMVEMAATVSAQ